MIRFSCGCIGFPAEISYQTDLNLPPIRLIDCRVEGDLPGSEYGAHFSPSLGEKAPYEPLTLKEATKALRKIQGLIRDGIKFNEIKSLLS